MPVACRWVVLIPVLAAVALFSCAGQSTSKTQGKVKAVSSRKPAPDFSLKDPDGKVVRLADYRGKVVLLNFWATWCGPCKIEMPWFIEFERRYKDRGFAVIGVSMDEEGWPVVKPFITNMAVNYRVVQGDDTTAELYGGVEALPTSFLIDREGRIAQTLVGLHGRDEFDHGIQELLGAQSAGTGAAGGPVAHAGAE
jgi:cytochrome c biogenesis protein CcmG/thiol:disulfide interchange protein DsbE